MKTLKLVNYHGIDGFYRGKMDIAIESERGPIVLTGGDLLLQGIIKSVITGRVSDDSYGSSIYSVIGSKDSEQSDSAFLTYEIIEAINKFRELQYSDSYVFDYTNSELFRSLDFVKIVRKNQYYSIFISIENQDGLTITENLIVRI